MSQLLVQTHPFSVCAENSLIRLPLFRLIPKKLQRTQVRGFRNPPGAGVGGGGGEIKACIISSSLNRDDLQECAVFPLRAGRSLQNRSFVPDPLSSRSFFTYLHDIYIQQRGRRPGHSLEQSITVTCLHSCLQPMEVTVSCWGFICSPKCKLSADV